MLSVAALPSLSLATATVAPRTVARAAAPQMGFGKAELAGAPSPERALASSALAGHEAARCSVARHMQGGIYKHVRHDALS